MNAKRTGLYAGVLALGLLTAACGSRGMRTVPQVTIAPPAANEAVIVFMRPSSVGEMYSTSLFELRPEGDRFVGILKGDSRLAYRAKPGRTRFMVVSAGGSDHFMDAEFSGGKTYYAVIEYGPSGSSVQYVLRPVRIADQEAEEFKRCAAQCAWTENTAKSEAWGRNHMAEIGRRKARSLPVWQSQPNRQALTSADGH